MCAQRETIHLSFISSRFTSLQLSSAVFLPSHVWFCSILFSSTEVGSDLLLVFIRHIVREYVRTFVPPTDSSNYPSGFNLHPH